MIARGALAALLLLGAAGCASAKPPAAPVDSNLTCTLHHGGARVDSLKALPASVRVALLKLSGAMADRGEFFNAGDVVSKPAPFNRFIRGGSAGRTWFAWYEHGGFAYWHQIVTFAVGPKGVVRLLADRRATATDLCAQTDALLDAAGPG